MRGTVDLCSRLALLAVMATAGCGHFRRTEALAPAVDVSTPGDASDRLRQAAKVARADGDVTGAVRAASTAQRASEIETALQAGARGRAKAYRGAKRQWRRNSRLARRTARVSEHPDAQLQAVLHGTQLAAHRLALRKALRDTSIDAPEADQLLRVLTGPRDRQRVLIAWVPSGLRGERSLWLERFDALPARSRRDPILLARAFSLAVDNERPAQELRARAEALLTRDPWHIPARLGLALADRATEDPLLWADVAGQSSPFSTQVVVRLQLRSEQTGDPAMKAALLYALIRAELVGDAKVVADAMGSGDDPELADGLRALVELQAGDSVRYQTWRRAHRGPMPWLDGWLALADRPGAPVDTRREGAQSRAQLLGVDGARPPAEVLVRTVVDRSAPRRIRYKALRALGSQPQLAAHASTCSDRRLDGDRCMDLWNGRDLDPLSDPAGLQVLEDAGNLGRIAASGNLDEQWMKRALQAKGGRDPVLLQAAIGFAFEQGRLDEAQALLSSSAATLPSSTLTLLVLRLADARAGLDVPGGPAWLPNLLTLGESDSPATSASPSDRGQEARLRRALGEIPADPDNASEELRTMAQKYPGRVRVQLLAYATVAALRSEARGAFEEAFRELALEAPESSATAMFEGLEALRSEDAYAAIDALTVALRRDPDNELAFEALWRAIDMGPGMKVESLEMLARAAPPSWRVDNEALVDAFAAGAVGSSKLASEARAVTQGEDGDTLAVAAAHPSLADAVIHAQLWRMREGLSVEEALATASLALGALEHVRDPWEWHWATPSLHMMVGRAQEGLALLTDRALPASYDADASMQVGTLLRARLAGDLTDRQAYELWRWQMHSGDENSDTLTSVFRGPWSPELTRYACLELADQQRHEEALPHCRAARRASTDPAIEASLAYVAMNAEDGTAPKDPFGAAPPTFLADSSLPSSARSLWYGRRADWLQGRGLHDDAARARLEALALGDELPDTPPEQFGVLARMVRHDELRNDWASSRSWARLAHYALLEGDLDVAEHYAGAATAAAAEAEVGHQYVAGHREAFVELARRDVQRGELDTKGVAEGTRLMFESGDDEEFETRVEAFGKAHPGSCVAQAVVAQWFTQRRQIRQTQAAVGRLRKLEPTAPMTAYYTAKLALLEDEAPRARATYAEALRRNPGHLLLVAAELPESVRGRNPDVPGWVRTRRAFDGAAGTAPIDALRVAHIPAAQDVFVPTAWELDTTDEDRLVVTAPRGAEISVRQRSRAARCEGTDCLADWLASVRGSGATIHWVEPIDTPAGPATRAVATTRTELFIATAVPSGGQVFQITGRAPLERPTELMAGHRLVSETFRPLDAVLPAFRAESVRQDGAKLSDDVRLRIRSSMAAAAGTPCPIRAVLQTMPRAPERSAALVDAWLTSGSIEQRRALVACVDPGGPEATRLGVLAVIDDDADLHAFGRKAVRADPEQALSAARSVFSNSLEPAMSSGDYFTRRDLPPSGMLSFARALPKDDQRRLVQVSIQHPDERERALGWTLAALLDDDTSARQWAVDEIESGDVVSAAWAVGFLGGEALSERELSVVRRRLDGIRPDPKSPMNADLAGDLAMVVASQARTGDKARLSEVARRFRGTHNVHQYLQLVARAHGHRLTHTTSKDPRVRSLLEVFDHVDSREGGGKWRAPTQVTSASLPELLRGEGWSYVRAGNPRLFATAVRSMLSRLEGDSPVDSEMLQTVVLNIVERAGGSLFEEGSSIDLGRPIECAHNPQLSPGAICVAYVEDARRLRTQLARRAHGDDSGLVLPLNLMQTLGAMPRWLSTIPVSLDEAMHVQAMPPRPEPVLEERSRDELQLGDHTLQRQVIVRARPGSLSIDNEFYLFSGDRVFAFTTRDLAEHALRQGEGALAADPEFEAMLGRARASSGLVAASMPSSKDAGLTEISIDTAGLVVRRTSKAPSGVSDSSRVSAALPEGASTTMTVARGIPRPQWRVLTDKGRNVPPPPPSVLDAEGSLSLGWYPRPGEDLWQGWVAVLEPTRTDIKRLRRARLWSSGRSGAIHHARVREIAVLSSDRELLRQTVGRLRRSPSSDRRLLASGTFRGATVAKTLGRLPNPGALDESFKRVAIAALGAVEYAEFEMARDGASDNVTMKARVDFDLAERDEAPELVDAWLASADLTNTLQLPRRVRDGEAERSLTFVVRVSDPQRFVDAALADDPRLNAKVTSKDTVRVEVLASAAEPKALTRARRRRTLAATSEYPSNDPRVRRIVGAVAGRQRGARARAEKIIAWTHQRIDYEVTPRRLSGRAVLDAGRGDCSEYAVLAVTMLRAAGIPAEERSGFAVDGDKMVAHAWVAYHDGERWVEVDPTAGTMGVTAGYVPMSLMETLSLRSIGQLEITSVEAAP